MPKQLNDWVNFGYSEAEWKALSKGQRWNKRNPEKRKQAGQRWRDKNKEYNSSRQRQYQLRDKYKITEQDYQKMLVEQNNQCAVCQITQPTGKWKVFAVDHCHSTNEVRGLLCNECNRGIGLLGDSVERLQQAINYLNKKKTKEENKK